MHGLGRETRPVFFIISKSPTILLIFSLKCLEVTDLLCNFAEKLYIYDN